MEATRAFRSAGALNPSEAASRRAEPTAAPLTFSRSRTGSGSGLEVTELRSSREGGDPATAEGSSPGSPFLLQDALWLQEISNLSEWLSSGPGP